MIAKKFIAPKEPFSDGDLLYMYRACEFVTDGRRHTQTQNGFESLVFLWCLRHTALRISDIVELSSDQLVPFEEDMYTHAIWCQPRKTKNSTGAFVHIPIPNANMSGENLVAALHSLPLKHGKYFFLNPKRLPTRCGCGERHCSFCKEWNRMINLTTNNWRDRLANVFAIAARLMEKERTAFSVHPHPHRFRHTFAARLLERGASLRMVASLLGDTEDTVREHYAKFCHAENRAAARMMAEISRSQQRTLPSPTLRLLAPWKPTPLGTP